MYKLTNKIVFSFKVIGILISCFILSAFICISQRKIINPDEISMNKEVLAEKTKIINELQLVKDQKEKTVGELEIFIAEKTKELEKLNSKATTKVNIRNNKNRS